MEAFVALLHAAQRQHAVEHQRDHAPDESRPTSAFSAVKLFRRLAAYEPTISTRDDQVGDHAGRLRHAKRQRAEAGQLVQHEGQDRRRRDQPEMPSTTSVELTAGSSQQLAVGQPVEQRGTAVSSGTTASSSSTRRKPHHTPMREAGSAPAPSEPNR